MNYSLDDISENPSTIAPTNDIIPKAKFILDALVLKFPLNKTKITIRQNTAIEDNKIIIFHLSNVFFLSSLNCETIDNNIRNSKGNTIKNTNNNKV